MFEYRILPKISPGSLVSAAGLPLTKSCYEAIASSIAAIYLVRQDLCLPALVVGRSVGAATLGVSAVALLLGPPTRTGRKARLSFRL